MVKGLVAHELTLAFAPAMTRRLWRTVTRRKGQLTRTRVQLQNRLEALLEEAHIHRGNAATKFDEICDKSLQHENACKSSVSKE
jgi:hypothetical protein